MKKMVIAGLTVLLSACMCACSQTAKNSSTAASKSETETSLLSTTQPRVTSKTAKVSHNAEKGKKLSAAVIRVLGNAEGASVKGETDTGSFTYIYNVRSTSDVYKNEESTEMEELAKKHAQSLVRELNHYYSDDIKYEKSEVETISGSGDNGIDSARYVIYYTNTQNQQLIIQADSDAVISYVKCDFTW